MGEEALKDYISILKDQLRIRISPSSQQSLKNILKICIVVHCFLFQYRVHVHIQSSRSFYTPDQIRQYSLCTGLVDVQFVHPLLDQTVQFMYRPSCYVVCTPPYQIRQFMYRSSRCVSCKVSIVYTSTTRFEKKSFPI